MFSDFRPAHDYMTTTRLMDGWMVSPVRRVSESVHDGRVSFNWIGVNVKAQAAQVPDCRLRSPPPADVVPYGILT